MAASVRISRRSAKVALDALFARANGFAERAALDEFQRALEPKPKSSAVRKTEKKRRTKAEEADSIRAVLEVRAAGRCESCTHLFSDADPAEMDHFFGRGKVRQTAQNCWLLHRSCHLVKTENRPSAAYWLRQFIQHAEKHGFTEEGWRACARLDAISITRREG